MKNMLIMCISMCDEAWMYSLMVEHLPQMIVGLGPTPSLTKIKIKE